MNWTYGKLPEPIHQILAPCQSNLVWPGSPAQRSISSGEAKRKNGASCHRGCTHLTKPRSATTGTDWPFVCGVIWESLSASMVWMQTLEVWLLLGPLCFFFAVLCVWFPGIVHFEGMCCQGEYILKREVSKVPTWVSSLEYFKQSSNSFCACTAPW